MPKAPLTISETHSGLLNKEFSAVELVDSYLEAIKKQNERLNIFLTVSEDVAYTQAKRADKEISKLGK